MSAFHVVLSDQSTEDAEMNKCKSAVHHVRKMERDVDTACLNGKLTMTFSSFLLAFVSS